MEQGLRQKGTHPLGRDKDISYQMAESDYSVDRGPNLPPPKFLSLRLTEISGFLGSPRSASPSGGPRVGLEPG